MRNIESLKRCDDLPRSEVARKKQTRQSDTTLLLFEPFWTPIAQRLMQALAIIKHLDILGEDIAGFRVLLKVRIPLNPAAASERSGHPSKPRDAGPQ